MAIAFLLVQGHKRPHIRAPDKEGFEDNSETLFLILKENLFCDLSLELSQTDSIMRGHNLCFMQKYGKRSLNYPCYPFLP